MEKIAVILPVYKKDKVEYLSLAVESILNQTYRDLHLFIGVDGPVGEDLHKSLELLEKQTRVGVEWFPENRGLACVLNDLIEICFKEGYVYIARMDADDISLPDRFAKQMSWLAQNPDADVVGGGNYRIDEKGEMISGNLISFPLTHEECVKQFAKRNPLGHPAVLFRKSFFDKAGLYRPDHRINQDTLLWYDGLMKGVVMGNVPDAVLYFRVSSDTLNSRRGGWKKAKKQLSDRLMINRGLHYGIKSDIYAIGVFCYMIAPTFIRKMVFKKLRT